MAYSREYEYDTNQSTSYYSQNICNWISPFFFIQYDGPLQFSVLEEVPPGWEVDTLRASDPDQGENAAIEYLIICKSHFKSALCQQCKVIIWCPINLDGDDAGLFTLERNPDNSARLLVKGRIDREAVDNYLLTVKCFKPAEKPSELRKPYNPQVTYRAKWKPLSDNNLYDYSNIFRIWLKSKWKSQ